MITFNEMLGRHLITDVPINIQQNMQDLLLRINVVRKCYGIPMKVNSGYRTVTEQLKINPAAPNSKHCEGRAIDIADADGALKAWAKDNLDVFEAVGLWLEDFDATKTWLHAQSVPPKSMKRVFKP